MLFKLTNLAGESDAITTSPAFSAHLGGLVFLTSSTQPCPEVVNFFKSFQLETGVS